MLGRSVLLAVGASLISSICFAKEPAMSNVKTYCFGRYLVDIPSEAEVNGQVYRYKFERIDTLTETQGNFEKRMSSRENELKSGKRQDGYALINVLRPKTDIRIFELSKSLITGPAGGLEAYRWDKGRTFSMQGNAYAMTRLPNVAMTLQSSVLPNLGARDPADIPSQPGFCLKDGFIADDGKTAQYEEAGISFKFPQWPGILVSVNSSTVTKLGEPKLLERMAKAPIPDAYKSLMSAIHDIRKGTRVAAGRDGEEVLSTVPTDGGYRLHQFQWEAQGSKIDDPLDPTLTVEFESGMTRIDGQPARPKLSDEEAVRLFDAVVNSIRLRPTNGSGKVSGVEPGPTLPVGTLAQTGSVCPQSGWWTCPEANGQEIVGGTRQHFAAGTVMPQVRVISRTAFLDRMLGKQQEHAVNTTWKLVGFDEEPPTEAPGESGSSEG
ncbi:T6SS immunity protein Tli4 family protein [Paraburkholderia kururiensis]|uniref:T6SS immunity protein Tli4 family protein n=1 Tax=Paraburkholderia kururiensis TaxID=984307 RepID=UPI0009E01D3D|nr:T6SS immunity protein Tli4 family protein [Paraburkholderia kururiensis]